VLIENLLAIRRDPMKGCVYVPFSTKQTKGKPFFVTMERANYIHPSALDALIESIRERGIQVIEGFNALHSAGLIYGILVGDTKERKKKGQRLPVIRTRKGLDTVNDEQEFFIAGFPGINVVRARSILERFGSPQEAIMQIDDWGQIAGIGPKTIATAKKLLFSDYEVEEPKAENNEESPEP